MVKLQNREDLLSLCLCHLFISFNLLYALRVLVIFLIFALLLCFLCLGNVCASVLMAAFAAHLQPPGPSEWYPGRHVSHFRPVTPTRHAHLPSTSHCRLAEPVRDVRQDGAREEKKINEKGM